MSAFENQLLICFSTGLMCLMDMRTGWIIETFKNHDNEIINAKFFSSNHFVTTYNDGSIGFNIIKDKVHLKQLVKVYSEPVSFMSLTDSQLITSTGSNKISVHSFIDGYLSSTFSINKLQSDYFKGFITSQTYLKLNRLLLVGSDYGDIRVVC